MGIELVKAEAEKAARSKNPDAIDLTMRGWALARPSKQTKEKNEAARALFEQALKIDPNNADALAGGAYTYTNEYVALGRKPETDYEAKILGPADQAIALAPDTLWAYYVKSVYLYSSHRADKAIDAADAGLAINPNFGSLRAVRGVANLFDGRFEQAKSDLRASDAVKSARSADGFRDKYLGDAELGLGHFDAAIDDYHKAIDLGLHVWSYASLTAAYALSGRMDEAKSALAEARRLEPKLTGVKWLTQFAPPIPNLFEGLRKAGLPEDAPPEPAHLSIVVLPFTNLSGDPSQDYFADGITENLTTDLSRIPDSFVIARNTAFTYKGKSVDAKEIGKELGVRYVLEGSVQRDQNSGARQRAAHRRRNRRASLGRPVRGRRGRPVQAAGSGGGEIGQCLGFRTGQGGSRKERPFTATLTPSIWPCAAGPTMWQSYPEPPKEKRDSHYAALALFDQALKADPNDADALAGEAFTHMALFAFAEATAKQISMRKIIDQADRAIALAPDNMRAYAAKSFYLADTGRANEALRAADSGLAIDPNNAPLLDARTLAEIVLGRFEQAKSDAQQAMRLSPRDPETPNRLINLGMAELGLGHFDAAIVEFQKAIDQAPTISYPT